MSGNSLVPQTAGRLDQIACATFVMTGEGDVGSPPHMSQNMAAAIPDARPHILAGQQHMMPVLDSANVNVKLRAFIDSI